MSDLQVPGFETEALAIRINPYVGRMYDAARLSLRAQTIGKLNPYMWENPEALFSLASTDMDLPDLARSSAAIYGIKTASDIRDQLEKMSEEAQRSTFGQLSPAQQLTLFQSGYRVPKRDEDAWYEKLVRGAGEVAGAGFGVLGDTAKFLQLDDALNVMMWLGDRPAQLYRTIRMMPEWSQAMAGIGAAAGIAALFLVPVTGGLSLAALGAVGGGTLMTAGSIGAAALAGGTVAAAATNWDDWSDAFGRGWGRDVYLGERSFLRNNERRADEILGDPRLVTAAKAMAELLPANVTVRDVAYAVAGQRGEGDQVAMEAMSKLASRYASEGTPQYQQIFDGMTQLLTLPQFNEAVETLQRGKISIGRDIAEWLTPFDKDSAAYSFVSGTVDAFSVLALDPILVGTKIAKARQAAKFGLVGTSGEGFAERFLHISRNEPSVALKHERLAKAVNDKSWLQFKREAPEFREIYDQLVAHRDSLRLGDDGFTVDHFREWVTGTAQMAPILAGFGTLRGVGGPIQLARISKTREAIRNATGPISSFVHGLTDARTEQTLLDYLERTMANGDLYGDRSLYSLFPEATHGDLRVQLLDKHVNIIKNRIDDAVARFETADSAVRDAAITRARTDGTRSVGMTTVLSDGRTVELDGLDIFDPSISATLDEVDRLASSTDMFTSVPVRVVDRDVLKQAALAGDEFPRARIAGRILGQSRPIGWFGGVLERVSTMAPAGSWVQLEGAGAGDSIERFVEMAGLTGMPQWMRRSWIDMMMDQPTGASRLALVQSFYENMLRLAGVDVLPEGEQLIAEFTNRVAQAYGGGGLDIVNLKSHWARRSLLLDEMAEGVSMPDLREINKMMRDGYSGKIMGALDSHFVEGFQSKVWKPAVLLRIGFIPRAAGEEMLSFIMRGGLGGLGQELGARTLARADRYYNLQQRIAAGAVRLERLGLEDRILLQRGPLPLGTRNVMRKLSRFEFSHPMNARLETFAKFRNDLLRNGVLKEGTVERGLFAGIAGAPLPISPTNTQAGLLAAQAEARTATQANRYALGVALDSLVFGNPYSWRRMAAGGVHDDLLEAAHQFWSTHGRTVLSEVGASNAAPIQVGWSDADAIQMRLDVPDGEGNMRPMVFVPLRGERRTYFRYGNDPFYQNAVHESMVRLADDELVSEVVLPHIARLPMPGMRPAGLDDVSIATANRLTRDTASVAVSYHNVTAFPANQLIDEFIDTPDYERIKTVINQLRSHPDADLQELGENLARMVSPSNPQLTDVLRAFDATTMPATPISPVMSSFPFQRDQLAKFIDEAMPVVDNLSPVQRTWLASYLRNTDGRYAIALAERAGIENEGVIALRSKLVGRPPISTPIYGSWDELRDAVLPELKGVLRDPRYASKTGLVQGVTDKAGQVGKFENVDLRRGQATIWVPRHGQVVTVPRDGGEVDMLVKDMTIDDLVALIPDREFVGQHYNDLQFWLEQRAAGKEVAFANRRIADEITRALVEVRTADATAGAGTARAYAVSMPKARLTPRDPEWMQAHLRNGRLHAWTVDELDEAARMSNPDRMGAFAGSYRIPNNTTDELLDEYAEDMFTFVRASTTMGTRRKFKARLRTLDDGSEEAVVYVKDVDGALVPVEPTRRFTERNEWLYDSQGNAVTVGNNRYFVDEIDTFGDEVMWPVMGRVLQDVADVQAGRVLLARKQDLAGSIGYEVDPNDVVRLYRSKASHVRDLADDAPEWIEGIAYTPLLQSQWEKFVRYGFDRIIGPSIDALARRPMAFHFFAKRYMQNMRLREWLRNPEMVRQVDDIVARLALGGRSERAAADSAREARDIATQIRTVAGVETGGIDKVASWSQNHSFAWLRSHSATDFDLMLDRVVTRAEMMHADGAIDAARLADVRFSVEQLRDRGLDRLVAMLPSDMKTDDFLAYVRSRISAFRDAASGNVARDVLDDQIAADPVLRRLDDRDWVTLINAQRNFDAISTEAGEAAAIAAINDMFPYIDSHEIRTQMAEIGKPFLPFWYAEENFMKRWVRTLRNEGPAVIRKAQLAYMGLKSAGTIRSDSTGKDWFIWPGSGLLADAIQKLPFAETIPAGVMFKSPTDAILPGFNSRVGTPQFGPLVSLPVDLMVKAFPELESAQRNVIGDVGASQDFLEQIVPSPLMRSFKAIFASDTDRRFMSAMFSAMALLEATGNGVPANASPGEIDEYLRRVRNHARIVVFTQAVGGWISPGPLTQQASLDEEDFWQGKDPSEILNPEYVKLVQELGIDLGTQRFLELFADSDLASLVTNPLAVTAGRSESRSGAPLPATKMAVAFYEQNSKYLDALPYATPWLLPIDEAVDSPASMYAYDQQTIEGLRRMQTPQEFIDELKFKEASSMYFSERRAYLDKVAEARGRNDRQEVSRLNVTWNNWSRQWKALHPIFAQKLEDSSSRERRNSVISEMRIAVTDPEAPETPVKDLLRQMIEDYDWFLARKAEMSLDGSSRGRARVEGLKGRYEQHMNDFVNRNPQVRSFWLSVLRPEAALD